MEFNFTHVDCYPYSIVKTAFTKITRIRLFFATVGYAQPACW